MKVRQLSGEECRTVLARRNVGRIACARDGQPYVVPILCYYDADGDCMYSVAAEGQKVRWMRDNPKVCMEVSEIVDRYNWTTVLVFGRYEELTESVADDHLRHRARELFERRHEWWLPGMVKPEPQESARTVVYRVRIDDVSGRQASHDPDART